MNCGNCRYGYECMVETGRKFKNIPLESGILTYIEKDGYYYEMTRGDSSHWGCSNSKSKYYHKRVRKSDKCKNWASRKSLSEVKSKEKTFNNYTCDNQLSLFGGENDETD